MSEHIFIYPTDTVWGIGSGIDDKESYLEIQRIKKSSSQKPLSIMFSHIDEFIDLTVDLDTRLKNWLEFFFTLETTLLFPLELLKEKIPPWITQNSNFVGVRVLNLNHIGDMYSKIGPFTSTSLNLAGEDPIKKIEDVKKFIEKNSLSDINLIEGLKIPLSGHASTIVKMDKYFKFEIVREGHRINDVQEQIRLFPT